MQEMVYLNAQNGPRQHAVRLVGGRGLVEYALLEEYVQESNK